MMKPPDSSLHERHLFYLSDTYPLRYTPWTDGDDRHRDWNATSFVLVIYIVSRAAERGGMCERIVIGDEIDFVKMFKAAKLVALSRAPY